MVLPGEEEEEEEGDVCLKKGSFASRFMVASLFGLLWLQRDFLVNLKHFYLFLPAAKRHGHAEV